MRLVGQIGLEVQYEIFPYLLQNPLQYLIKKKVKLQGKNKGQMKMTASGYSQNIWHSWNPT